MTAIDLGTLRDIQAGMLAVMAVLQLLNWLQNPAVPGTRWWFAGAAAAALALPAFQTDRWLTPVGAITLSNALWLAAAVATTQGLRNFAGAPRRLAQLAACAGLGLALQAVMLLQAQSSGIRWLVASVFEGGFAVVAILALRDIAGAYRWRAAGFVAAAMLASAVTTALVAALALSSSIDAETWMETRGFPAYLLVVLVAAPVQTVGLLLLTTAHLDRQLLAQNEALSLELARREAAEREFHTLSGLLPVCATCGKVRDDQGYWGRLEGYISSRSDVLFAQSLCETCLDRREGGDPERLARARAQRASDRGGDGPL